MRRAGKVDSQFPEAGTSVPFGSRVTLQVSQTNSTVTLPDIAGQPADEAESALEEQGFDVQWGSSVDSPSDWIATETSPKAGSKVAPGSTATISVVCPPGYEEPSEPAAPSTDDSSGLYDDGSGYSGYDDYLGYDSYSDDSLYGDDSYRDDSGDKINGGKGNGYAVKCSNGKISHSGGIHGACSHHGGVAG